MLVLFVVVFVITLKGLLVSLSLWADLLYGPTIALAVIIGLPFYLIWRSFRLRDEIQQETLDELKEINEQVKKGGRKTVIMDSRKIVVDNRSIHMAGDQPKERINGER